MDNSSKEFKALQGKWYTKLEKSGFEDIEKEEGTLKWSPRQTLNKPYNRDRKTFIESKEVYFRLAGYFLYDHLFVKKNDRMIWKLHAEGMSYRQISALLKAKRIKKSVTSIKETIHRLRSEMFSRYKDFDNEQE